MNGPVSPRRDILRDWTRTYINAKSEGYDCYSALHTAAKGSNEAVVSLLIDRGADINAQGGIYGNALETAIMMDHEAVVRLLINHGADVNSQARQLGCCNALEAAILKGNETVVRLLIDHGADIYATNYFGSTALDEAIRSKHQAVISLLLESSATNHTLQDESNDSDNICIEEQPGDDSESSTLHGP